MTTPHIIGSLIQGRRDTLVNSMYRRTQTSLHKENIYIHATKYENNHVLNIWLFFFNSFKSIFQTVLFLDADLFQLYCTKHKQTMRGSYSGELADVERLKTFLLPVQNIALTVIKTLRT